MSSSRVPATTGILVDGVLMDIAGCSSFEDEWRRSRLWDRALAVMDTHGLSAFLEIELKTPFSYRVARAPQKLGSYLQSSRGRRSSG